MTLFHLLARLLLKIVLVKLIFRGEKRARAPPKTQKWRKLGVWGKTENAESAKN